MTYQYEIRQLSNDFAVKIMNIDACEAEKICWRGLDHRELKHNATQNDKNLLKTIAWCLCKSFKLLAEILVSELAVTGVYIYAFDSQVNLMQPPIHRMMESNYAYTVSDSIFREGEFQDSDTAGMRDIIEVMELFSMEELLQRDSNGREPLHLAVSQRREGLARGILNRAYNIDGTQAKRILDSRDLDGDSVLTCAIRSGCSSSFIKYLITEGTEVNPDPIMESQMPLEVASYKDRLDIYDSLVEHGADPGRITMSLATLADITRQGEYFGMGPSLALN